jgi:hypothetical protein
MKNGRAKARRADLRRVRQDILVLLEEHEARITQEVKLEAETPPAILEVIAIRMLDELGGGEFRIMLKGEQTLAQRVAELAEEKERQLKRIW